MEKISMEFKNYHKLLIIGFSGGMMFWIFSFTFESLKSQINDTFYLFVGSLLVAIIWYFLFSIPLFFILKLFGINFLNNFS